MKQTTKTVFTVLISLLTLKATAQTPRFYQPVMYGDASGNEYVKGIIGNSDGSYYVTGSFSGSTFNIGSFTLNNSSGSGTSDIFIAKYSSQNSVLWATSAGGSQADSSVSIAKDGAGNVYIAGTFKSSNITFGTTTLSNSSTNTKDMFLVKYDANGTVVWAKRAGGTSDDNLTDITIDNNDNIYIVGDFTSTTLAFGTTTLNNQGLNDIFYTKYDSNGNPVWANTAGSLSPEYAKAVTTDTAGNVFITGSQTGGSFMFGSFSLSNNGNENDFIAKVASSGTVVWAHTIGGNAGNDKSSDILADINGNIFVAGSFSSNSLLFDNSPLQVANAGGYDIYLVKYSNAGTVLWANGMGGTGDEFASALNVDACGYIYVTGSFNSTPTLSFASNTLTNQGLSDLLVLKYDENGTAIWGKSCGSTGYETGTAVSGNIKGNVIVAGYTNSISVALDGTTINNHDGSGATNDYLLTKVQTTATDIYVNVVNSSAQPVSGGMVYLYSRQSALALIHPVDSISLTSGHVHFASVLNLNYFVKVTPDTLSNPGMITTYNGHFSLWDSIATWPHTCSSNDTIDITMIQGSNSGTGNGKISGYVRKTNYYGLSPTLNNSYNRSFGDPVPGGDVKLGTNPGGQMVASTVTNTNGQYSFNNIDIGNYTIYVDIPGLGRDSSHFVSITSTNTVFIQQDYIADSDYIYIDSILTNITNNNKKESERVFISPNPFTSQTTIYFADDSQNKLGTETKTVTLTDILGNEIRAYRVSEAKKLIIEKGDLQPGVYFIRVQSPDKTIINRKIVIQ